MMRRALLLCGLALGVAGCRSFAPGPLGPVTPVDESPRVAVPEPLVEPAPGPYGISTAHLSGVYEAPPDVVRAAALELLHHGFQIARRDSAELAVVEGDSGEVVVFDPAAPGNRLTLVFSPYGRHARMDARFDYSGELRYLLPAFHESLAGRLSGDRGSRWTLLPIATYTDGQPPCLDARDLTPEGVFARSIEAEPEVLEAVERVPEPIGGLYAFRPGYPETARRRGIEGRVMTQFVVQVDGSVTCIEALSGPLELAPAALAAVAAVRFIPGRHHDTPVPVRFTLPLNFRLD